MKTLYININNKNVSSNEELEVLNYDLDSDFFFYLGEMIASGCKQRVNENRLVTDFNTKEYETDYAHIIEQWNELKEILFGENPTGTYEFILPEKYIDWLRYNPNEAYRNIYENKFVHNEYKIFIDIEVLYEDSVETLQRKILRKLKDEDFYLEIDEIVFNDDAVTRKSPIVRAIKDKYEGIGFKSYKKWLLINEEQNIDELENTNVRNLKKDLFFPIHGVILGITTIQSLLGKDFLTKHEPVEGTRASMKINGVEFYATYHKYKKDVIKDCKIEDGSTIPRMWVESFDWSFNLTMVEWANVLHNHMFIIYEYGNGRILAQSPDFKYRILISFLGIYARYINIDLMPQTAPRSDIYHKILQDKKESIDNLKYEEDCVIKSSSCPNCSSDDIEDLGPDYSQYFCNDCGHVWGYDLVEKRWIL